MFISKYFSRNKKQNEILSEREKGILERELKESTNSSMPSSTSTNTFGDGSSINNISRISATINQNEITGIVGRRITEPRKNWPEEEQNKI